MQAPPAISSHPLEGVRFFESSTDNPFSLENRQKREKKRQRIFSSFVAVLIFLFFFLFLLLLLFLSLSLFFLLFKHYLREEGNIDSFSFFSFFFCFYFHGFVTFERKTPNKRILRGRTDYCSRGWFSRMVFFFLDRSGRLCLVCEP